MTDEARAALIVKCDQARAKWKERGGWATLRFDVYQKYLEACAELYEYDHPTPEPVDDDPADPPGAR